MRASSSRAASSSRRTSFATPDARSTIAACVGLRFAGARGDHRQTLAAFEQRFLRLRQARFGFAVLVRQPLDRATRFFLTLIELLALFLVAPALVRAELLTAHHAIELVFRAR